MQRELARKAITQSILGPAIIALLLVLFIGLGKEIDAKAFLGGTVHLGTATR